MVYLTVVFNVFIKKKKRRIVSPKSSYPIFFGLDGSCPDQENFQGADPESDSTILTYKNWQFYSEKCSNPVLTTSGTEFL